MTYLANHEYRISQSTMAIQRAFHLEYESVIYDRKGTYYSKKPVMTLLEESCLRAGSKMKGRLDAARHTLTIRNKIPLIIDPLTYLYAFPTHSSTHDQNIWFFPPHVVDQRPHPDNPKKTIVILSTNEFITANCSLSSFRNQQKRTSQLFYEFSFSPRIDPNRPRDPFPI